MTEDSIFTAALAIGNPSERAAFLNRVCRTPATRREIDALLAAHAASNVLDRPPADLAQTGAYESESGASANTGDHVGPYKLLERIGEGGMGEVWVADQQEPIKRRVALKLIKPGMDSRAVLARFEAERQALAVMDHPNIAKVLDAGTTPDGRPFFVMELVKGTPITELCDARKLSPRERLELFIPVCQAIQHAHMKGIIHRDIKPTNVLVALHHETPVPKVIDFGVAKAIGQQLTEKTIYTGFGALIGTPAYMAPEQATFNQLDVDTRADVYALGVLLYELLTGSPPVEPERLKKAALDEVLRIVRDEEPPRPSQRLSTSQAKATIAAVRQSDPAKLSNLLRGEVDWIVMKALEKDRSRRYDTATALAKDVQRYLSGDAVEACPPTLGYRVWKAYRKNRTAVKVASAFVCMGFGAVMMGAVLAVQAKKAERAAENERETAVEERNIAENARQEMAVRRDELRRANYFANIALAGHSMEAGQLRHTRELLELTRPKDGETDLRGFEWHYLRRAVETEKDTLGPLPTPGECIAFSPDGQLVAVVCGSNDWGSKPKAGHVSVWSLLARRELYRLEIRVASGGSVAFSPDGQRLAVSGFSLYGGNDNRTRSEVWICDAATGLSRVGRRFAGEYPAGLAFSPDGSELAFIRMGTTSSANFRMSVLDTSTCEEIASDATSAGNMLEDVAYTASSELLLAWVDKKGTVRIRNTATGKEMFVFNGEEWKVHPHDVFLNRNGTHMGVLTDDHIVRVWDVTGENPVLAGTLRADLVSLTSRFTLSRDGLTCAMSQGAYGGQLAFVWDVKRGQLLHTARGHSAAVRGVAFSPDGRTLATTADDKTIKLWEVHARRDGANPPEGHGSALACRADGGFSVLTLSPPREGAQPVIHVRDLASSKELFQNRLPDDAQFRWNFRALHMSPDASRLLCAGWGNPDHVQVWDVSTRTLVPTLPAEGIPGTRARFGTTDIVVVGHKDYSFHIWNLRTGEKICECRGAPEFTNISTMSPDGGLMAAGSPDSILIWDGRSGKLMQTLPQSVSGSLCFSPDGRFLATSDTNDEIVIWDVARWQRIRQLKGHSARIYDLQFSPDGRQVFSGSADKSVKVWDNNSGQELLTLRHEGWVTSMALSPQGHRLATLHQFDPSGQIFDATPLEDRKK